MILYWFIHLQKISTQYDVNCIYIPIVV
jgi:hypothetical protein